MWLANIQCQRLSISGYSFAGSDIGGFIETPTGELYIRWLALGVFHPFCRTHSSGDHGDQEPWSFGEENTNLARKFIELRYQFLPYMYTTFWQYVTKGTPMLKPLVYLDQYDSETYLRMAEFGLGENILVCPITQAEAEGRWLYLPRGNWYYYWTDELTVGGKEIWADAKLDRIPLYVKAGAVIPMYPVQQYVGEKEIKELTLHVYYKKGSHESTLYEDAGEGYDYETGQCTVKKFIVTGTADSLTLEQTAVGCFTASYKTYRIVLHGLPFTASTGKIDGNIINVAHINPEEGLSTYIITASADLQKLTLN
jgi:alpha-glucosidase